MKGDFTRDTFQPEKHYQQVLMQQGRVQLDADWNEQAAIAARRDETMLADLAGHCGGPAENAAFRILTQPKDLSDLDYGALRDWVKARTGTELSADKTAATLSPGDFILTSGRYYVDGIQCELEQPVLFTAQPDASPESLTTPPSNHLIYLDVWQRHLTMFDDGDIREVALGGPDTATRVKTVWQVRSMETNAADCVDAANELAGLTRDHLPQLKARTALANHDSDPCALPVSAGYRGLENQLYRVEIHESSPPTFKWSRENGSVVTGITAITASADGTFLTLTVTGIGPDDVLGFKNGDIVELLDDSHELEGSPGKLAVIDGKPERNTVKLSTFGSHPLPEEDDLDLERHPKLRRWDGVADVVVPTEIDDYLALDSESGIEIRFDADGDGYRTGDYWLIPARAATTAGAASGDIQWPRELDADGEPRKDKPLPQPPRGVAHHYCRLGMITVQSDGTLDDTATQDCRCLWPALTSVPRLFYVSGDGQEVMPDLTESFKLPRPLIVGVANAHCLDRAVSVRFQVEEPSNGVVAPVGETPTENEAKVPLDSEGLAKCDFHLDGTNATQQVTARLLDAAGKAVSLPIIFNANLSIASQVAYQPNNCSGLDGQTTVQQAIDHLAGMASIYKLSGDGQQAAAGAELKDPLRVLVANRCGPVANVPVHLGVILGGGAVSPAQSTTDASGVAICDWRLGDDSALQVVEAKLPDDGPPTTEPRRVHFIAHLSGEGSSDVEPVRIVGMRYGKSSRVLVNGQTMSPQDLAAGLSLLCDQVIDVRTVLDPQKVGDQEINRGQPTCFVTVEVPYPLTRAEQGMWDVTEIAGYRPMILHGQVSSKPLSNQLPPIDAPTVTDRRAGSVITWKTSGAPVEFLTRVLAFLKGATPRPDKVLARLTLKGNFIWSKAAEKLFNQGTPGGYLDGDSFRAPPNFDGSGLLLPSGDNRRGGDFEMWFWLEQDAG